MFLDETSACVGQSREYGWAPSCERVHDVKPEGKKERVSLIAAVTLEGIMAKQALVVTDTINKNAFLTFLETVLLPTLTKGSVIVMDNWTVHYGEDVNELVDRFGCELLYLPTYSPDLSPIEQLFAKLKALIKRLRPETIDNLIQAFCEAVRAVTPRQVLNTFEPCGYMLEQ